ncbi:L-2-hydroxyglutarate oxidase [Armatimonas rosea]|uniref:L-2-hydroxyglutarate oxidase n=1 Tax=Armatimonas rosea TaxID=685828 RepID=A0A7W9SVE7_ARMRO|nr:L-2-hydroxyglutarate oxidase [Armatimonas rosea]MBB6053406.1 L-2-hydroxyglutarate oxidase [Armatimonas rosea]
MFDYAVIGGGIVGLATLVELGKRHPTARLLLVEKEDRWAAHQTGHNSGVIHSGIYYKPGSAKARMAVAGARRMVEFCQQHGVAHERCGKLIVASHPDELPRLETLAERALANGVPVERLGPERLTDYEPAVRGVGGLWVAQTGIIDYRQVTEALADQAREQGAELCRSTKVTGLTRTTDSVVLETTRGSFESRFVINCAGLYSDKVAELAGAQPGAKIVPFRGEYYELVPERRGLVRGLIYPVPNPSFPFLGVHFTRMIDGSVHAGPNAVLALAREGYKKSDLQLGELWETLTYPAFWRLAVRHGDEGLREIARSLSKALFVRSMQTLIPEIRPEDVIPAGAGVRAQALRDDGQLVDDFLFVRGERQLHVCNAPSPAATASLEIAREIVAQLAN